MKKAVPIKQLVNWFYGNYCTRKCYKDEKRQRDHVPKLYEFAKRLNGTFMTHQRFLSMLRVDKTICDLSEEEWKNRKFSWWHTDCLICRRFGIR